MLAGALVVLMVSGVDSGGILENVVGTIGDPDVGGVPSGSGDTPGTIDVPESNHG